MRKIDSQSKLLFIGSSIFMILIIALSSTVAVVEANVVGLIYPIDELKDSYTPEVHNDGWNYYVLPAGSDNYASSGVIYEGNSVPSSAAFYTDVSTNGFSSNGYSLTNGFQPNTLTLQDDTYFVNYHDFYDDINYPRAIRINSNYIPTFDMIRNNIISLHMEQSLTFLCDGITWLEASLNHSEPFYLDIAVHNRKASGTIVSSTCNPGTYSFGNPESEMTFPFIPIGDSLQSFWIDTNDTTLITLTPHEFTFPKWFPTIEKNELFEGIIDQGDTIVKTNTSQGITQPDDYIFSLRVFNLSLVKDTYYKIYTLFDMEEIKPGTPGKTPVMFVLGDTFEYISGSLNKNGYVLRSLANESITVVMFSPGVVHGSYSIFFQEQLGMEPVIELPLPLNVNSILEPERYYNFTLDSPSVIRANFTGVYLFDIYSKIYAESNESLVEYEWVKVSDNNFINTNWKYIPAGSYAVRITGYSAGSEIRFTVIPVEPLSGAAQTFNEKTIKAYEIPVTNNRITNINLSTTDHKNQSVTYSCQFTGQYSTFISESSSCSIGNQEINGVWEAFNFNETEIAEFLPTREFEVPILIITPTLAENLTAPIDTFTSSLKITSGIAYDQSIQYRNIFGYDAFSGSGFAGVFIPKSQISSTTTYTINDDITTNQDHVYGIPLVLDSDSIYNITVYLIGNVSSTLNATFQNQLRVMGGNLRSLQIFNSFTSGSTNEQSWQSTLVLSVSKNKHYLYFDVVRSGLLPSNNATIRVSITKLPITPMTFDIDRKFNENISIFETKNTKFAEVVTPAEMKKSTPGFELMLGVASFTSIILYIRKRKRNTRK